MKIVLFYFSSVHIRTFGWVFSFAIHYCLDFSFPRVHTHLSIYWTFINQGELIGCTCRTEFVANGRVKLTLASYIALTI